MKAGAVSHRVRAESHNNRGWLVDSRDSRFTVPTSWFRIRNGYVSVCAPYPTIVLMIAAASLALGLMTGRVGSQNALATG